VQIWDTARFHTGKEVVVPANITLPPLPPYAPELNPVGNLWPDLRSPF
jgi:transposase